MFELYYKDMSIQYDYVNIDNMGAPKRVFLLRPNRTRINVVTCLDAYAYYSILTHRLFSLFGLKGRVLSWLQSYLFSRSFIVNINATLSATFPVLQGSVLGLLLFILYTTPADSARNLGVIIFDSSLTLSDHISSVFKSCFLFKYKI